MAKYSPEEIKRLDDRMAEMDRLRSDPTMKLVRTKSGKFQYVLKEPELKSLSNISTAKSTPAASKPASDVYKPGTSSGPLKRPNLSTPTPYRTRGLGVSNEGAREELQALSNRTSPRTNKLPPRKYSAGETKNMADLEPSKKGSLANQYRKESRMKDLASTAEIMATMVGGRGAGKVVGKAFEGATIPGLMEGAAATIPGKIVRPAKEMGEKLSRRASDIYSAATGRGYKKGGKVGESKGMAKREVEFFKKKKAPKAMIKHEMSEMKKEGGMRKMAKGGMSCMKKGGDVPKFAKGGSIDGCAVRGKTKLKRVKM